jgi:WD40 repeat protein
MAQLVHSTILCSAVFSPDDAQVRTSSWDHTTRLWETAMG